MSTGAAVHVATCPFGLGVFASRDFSVGETVLSIAGEPTLDPADGSLEEAMLIQTGPASIIRPGPPACYLNHACDPNTAFAGGHLSLVGLRPIATGDHISFDYSTCIMDDAWRMECGCGSASCRRVIGDFLELQPWLQKRLVESGQTLNFIADRWFAR